MRALLYKEFGNPADVVHLEEHDVPQPSEGEVRIKMIMAPIHNHDLVTVRGLYGYVPELPAIGGSEAVGLIDELGPGVTHLAKGQRVVTASVHNTWAEYFIAPVQLVIPIPEQIPNEIAAQLVAMPLSALMLLDSLGPKPGQWILQNAANGAVGKNLALLAAARGVNTVSIVRRAESVTELKAMGISNVVSTESPDWKSKVRALTDGGDVIAAVDSVGGAESGELLSLVSDGGTLVSFGSMSGKPLEISPASLIFKDTKIIGFWGTKTSRTMSADKKKLLLGELIERVLTQKLSLSVGGVYPLEDVKLAIVQSQSVGKGGKVLFKP